MLIATIKSSLMMDMEDNSPGDYLSEVRINYTVLKNSGAPQAYAQHIIAQHLAKCVHSTGLPLNEKLWHISFSPWAQKHLGFPQGFTT